MNKERLAEVRRILSVELQENIKECDTMEYKQILRIAGTLDVMLSGLRDG